MSRKVSKGLGVMAVIAKRMVDESLPRALEIKDRVDRGEVLSERDISFFQRVLDDAAKLRVYARDPNLKPFGARVLQLYNEITRKAIENEKRREMRAKAKKK